MPRPLIAGLSGVAVSSWLFVDEALHRMSLPVRMRVLFLGFILGCCVSDGKIVGFQVPFVVVGVAALLILYLFLQDRTGWSGMRPLLGVYPCVLL